eukprot:7593849-Alexandrium_andersonii.AAC.1
MAKKHGWAMAPVSNKPGCEKVKEYFSAEWTPRNLRAESPIIQGMLKQDFFFGYTAGALWILEDWGDNSNTNTAMP